MVSTNSWQLEIKVVFVGVGETLKLPNEVVVKLRVRGTYPVGRIMGTIPDELTPDHCT